MSDHDSATGARRADEDAGADSGVTDDDRLHGSTGRQGGHQVAPEGSGKQFADDQTEVDTVGNPADPDSGKGFAQGQADLEEEPGLPGHPREDDPAP